MVFPHGNLCQIFEDLTRQIPVARTRDTFSGALAASWSLLITLGVSISTVLIRVPMVYKPFPFFYGRHGRQPRADHNRPF